MITALRRSDLPLTFRHAETRFVLDRLHGGESVCVVGVSGTGKSNFARFLARADVRAAHLGDAGRDLLTPLVDSHSLADEGSPDWRLYELMVHRLIQACQAAGVDAATVARMDDLYGRLADGASSVRAGRYLERCVDLACHAAGRRVAFVFDELDPVLRDAGRQVFLNLRALRDAHKADVMFVVMLRDTPARVRVDAGDIEAFTELLSLSTIALGGYGLDDSRDAVARLATQWHADAAAAPVEALWRATGGHPGMLRAAYRMVCDGGAKQDGRDLTPAALLADPGVAEECLKLWISLSDDERTALAALAAGDAPGVRDGDAARSLAFRRLIDADGAILSPVLAELARTEGGDAGGLVVDHAAGEVRCGPRRIALTPLEFKLLAHLDRHRGELCPRDALLAELYPDDVDDVDDNRLDVVAARLRKKLGPGCAQLVVTVRGRGFKLAPRLDDPR